MGEQAFGNRNSDLVAADRRLSHRQVKTKAPAHGPRIRPNADSTIGLLTLGTACFLHVQPNNLAAHGFNGIATFGKMHAVIRDDVDAEDPPS